MPIHPVEPRFKDATYIKRFCQLNGKVRALDGNILVFAENKFQFYRSNLTEENMTITSTHVGMV